MSNKKILYLIVISRACYYLFAVFVYSKFSQLGDTQAYVNGGYLYREDFSSTAYIMSLIGGTIGSFGTALLAIALSSYALYFLYNKIDYIATNLSKKIILFIIISPSLGIWTSIFSKEMFLLFFMSLAVGALIDFHRGRCNIMIAVLSFLVVTFMKPHYSLALYLSWIAISLNKLDIKGYRMLFGLGVSILLVFYVGFIKIDTIYEYTQLLVNNYFVNGESSRENNFWIGTYDFFSYAPTGITKAFIGPTLFEAIERPIFIPYFIEGFFLYIIVIYLMLRSIFHRNNIHGLYLALFFSFSLWLLFAHYPVGVINPGSAIRYRSGFIYPMVIFLVYTYSDRLNNSLDSYRK
ncbi:hypothetical protein [Salinivibrio costicola]|uniref:hypothetical protein n=1 Tax=Salinivibrio costicola TaxID=51367 RepID=UPI003F706EE7